MIKTLIEKQERNRRKDKRNGPKQIWNPGAFRNKEIWNLNPGFYAKTLQMM